MLSKEQLDNLIVQLLRSKNPRVSLGESVNIAELLNKAKSAQNSRRVLTTNESSQILTTSRTHQSNYFIQSQTQGRPHSNSHLRARSRDSSRSKHYRNFTDLSTSYYHSDLSGSKHNNTQQQQLRLMQVMFLVQGKQRNLLLLGFKQLQYHDNKTQINHQEQEEKIRILVQTLKLYRLKQLRILFNHIQIKSIEKQYKQKVQLIGIQKLQQTIQYNIMLNAMLTIQHTKRRNLQCINTIVNIIEKAITSVKTEYFQVLFNNSILYSITLEEQPISNRNCYPKLDTNILTPQICGMSRQNSIQSQNPQDSSYVYSPSLDEIKPLILFKSDKQQYSIYLSPLHADECFNYKTSVMSEEQRISLVSLNESLKDKYTFNEEVTIQRFTIIHYSMEDMRTQEIMSPSPQRRMLEFIDKLQLSELSPQVEEKSRSQTLKRQSTLGQKTLKNSLFALFQNEKTERKLPIAIQTSQTVKIYDLNLKDDVIIKQDQEIEKSPQNGDKRSSIDKWMTTQISQNIKQSTKLKQKQRRLSTIIIIISIFIICIYLSY